MVHRRSTADDDRRLRVTTTRLAAPPVDPLPAYHALAQRFGRDGVYLLESGAGPISDCRYTYLGFGPLLTITVADGVVTVDGVPAVADPVTDRIGPLLDRRDGRLVLRERTDLWDVLRRVESVFDVPSSADEYDFGFLAYFGYDAARYIEVLPHLIEPSNDLPDVHLVLYQAGVIADATTGTAQLVTHECAAWPRLDPDEIVALLRSGGSPGADSVPRPECVADDVLEETYLSNVDKCLEHIAIGDIYQVQIGHELAITSRADAVRVYQRLRARNPSPYMYLAPLGPYLVIGASPELFVRVEHGQVTMRPIAGTIPRGEGGDEAAAADRLRTDPKEIAEHVMLVDLCRNDIGRICRRDSLDVPERLVVEGYSHVLHLVSTVTGAVAEDADGYDVIAALFPAGTMTGAPKIRAMEIIEEVESSRRGLYAGALGVLSLGGYLNLALCIRTLVYRDGVYRTRASAGVVADSKAPREWTETLAKSSAAYWAVTGEELL